MLRGVDSEPGPPLGRQREIDTRLDAIRARLKQLRERDRGWDAIRSRAAAPSERLAAAQRHAAEAQAAAAQVLASSAEAFRDAAEAHELAASMHEKTTAAGTGDMRGHERQAALHRAAAAADRQRAERVLSLFSDNDRAGLAPVSDELRGGATR
jgi:hypothetical protein